MAAALLISSAIYRQNASRRGGREVAGGKGILYLDARFLTMLADPADILSARCSTSALFQSWGLTICLVARRLKFGGVDILLPASKVSWVKNCKRGKSPQTLVRI